jgi:transcriptional regulator with XRE-family HTH domain
MVKYDRKEMGRLLRKKRVSSGLTQHQASHRLGYSSSQFVSNIERGISVAPLEILGKLSRLYKFKDKAIIDLLMDGSKKYLREAFTSKKF